MSAGTLAPPAFFTSCWAWSWPECSCTSSSTGCITFSTSVPRLNRRRSTRWSRTLRRTRVTFQEIIRRKRSRIPNSKKMSGANSTASASTKNKRWPPTVGSTRKLALSASRSSAPWTSSRNVAFPCARKPDRLKLPQPRRSPRHRKRKKQRSEQQESQFDVRNDPCGGSRPRLSGRAKLDSTASPHCQASRQENSVTARIPRDGHTHPRVPSHGPGHVERHNVPAGQRSPALSAERRHRTASRHAGAARPRLHRRHWPLREARRLLRQKAADPEPRLLQLHHALRGGSGWTHRRHEDGEVRRWQRIRSCYREFRSARDARARGREKTGLHQALRPPRRSRRLAFSDRPGGIDQCAH